MRRSTEHAEVTGQHGFTLLETLVALTILAISLTALLQTYSAGLRNAGTIDDYTRARLIAQSLLTQYSASWTLRPSSAQGRSGDQRWRVTISKVSPDLVPVNADSGWQMMRVSVLVNWPPERSISLSSLKLARNDAEE